MVALNAAMRRPMLVLLAVMSTTTTLAAGSNPKDDFASAWKGQAIVLKQRLHTLSYRERGLLGNGSEKRDGLFVATPFNGTYYQFDGRQSKDDLKGTDPQKVMDAIHSEYGHDAIDVRSYAKVEPIILTVYEPGVELIVSRVRIDRDRLRLFFIDPRTPDATPATALTIQWPTPFTHSFSERQAVEAIIQQYIRPRRR